METMSDPCNFDIETETDIINNTVKEIEAEIVRAANNQPATMEFLYIIFVNNSSNTPYDTPFVFFRMLNALLKNGNVIPVFMPNGNWIFHSSKRLGSWVNYQ
jgi:hypothetical protein